MDKSSIPQICDRAIRYSFYAFFYFLPFSIAIGEILVSAGLILFFIKRGTVFYFHLREAGASTLTWGQRLILFFKSVKPLKTPLNWPIGIFILINALSAVFSQNVEVSLWGFLGKVLHEAYIYFTFIEVIRTKSHLRILLGIFLVSAAFVGLDALKQFFTGASFIYHHPLMDGRVTASFKHPNDLGSYLVIASGVVMGLLFLYCFQKRQHVREETEAIQPTENSCSGIGQSLVGLALILLLSILGMTFSRGAWIGILAVFLLLGWKERRLVPILATIMVIFGLIFFPWMEKVRNASFLTDSLSGLRMRQAEIKMKRQLEIEKKRQAEVEIPRVQSSELSALQPSNKVNVTVREKIKSFVQEKYIGGMGRFVFWKGSWEIIRDYPLLGTGVNTYSSITTKRQIAEGGYAHNCYLQMASETGILGLLSFLWIIFVLYRTSCRGIRQQNDRFLLAVLSGTLAGLTGFLVHIFFDTGFYSVQLGNLMWAIFGIIMVVQSIADGREHGEALG